MKDYAQYSSRIPAPVSRLPSPGSSNNYKRSSPISTPTSTTTRNVSNHPLNSSPSSNTHKEQQARERDSSTTASTTASTTLSSPLHHNHNPNALNASDALALRKEGPEPTIHRLRSALDQTAARDSQAKAALAKSDAVILELRSSIRQVKRQLEHEQQETREWKEQYETIQHQLQKLKQQGLANPSSQQYQEQIQQLQQRLQQVQSAHSQNENVGELQVQLDRAHAQILTADMVRKELEDTLEAEQYTWELRVQDQERTITQLEQDIQVLTDDLENCRSQWKEAEDGWTAQVQELTQQLQQARNRIAATSATQASTSQEQQQLQEKMLQLEQERAELQGCLDEALQELEAVDSELQTDDVGKATAVHVVEPLQHMLRWILQESGDEKKDNYNNSNNLSKSPKELLSQIEQALVQTFAELQHNHGGGGNVQELETQVHRYKEELKSREASSVELRESLKEAVALLKPLQDAVANAEEEKGELQIQVESLEQQKRQEAGSTNQELNRRQEQISTLQEQVQELQEQIEDYRRARASMLASPKATPNKSAPPTPQDAENGSSLTKLQKAREELRRKRETEGNLQQLLKDAQNRFHSLHQQNEDHASLNRELQGKLQHAENQASSLPQDSMEQQLEQYQQEITKRDKIVASLRQELQARVDSASSNDVGGMQQELEELRISQQRMQELDAQLLHTRNNLAQKGKAERMLNKSLKDALGLLKPLQMHLEDAEKEKMEISKELRNLRKRFRQLQMGEGDAQSQSTMGVQDVSIEIIRIKEELEETVRQLEMENSQLHDALEDISQSEHNKNRSGGGGGDAKLRQKLVELNSRYEVTQNKLEDAHVENHALVKALKQKELEDKKRNDEIWQLRDQFKKSESELHNAKAIARSALVKVEELTMSHVELSLSQEHLDRESNI
jgi:chromosome segregation ATPase